MHRFVTMVALLLIFTSVSPSLYAFQGVPLEGGQYFTSFSDVPEDGFYSGHIQTLLENGVVQGYRGQKGYPIGKYDPEEELTRAEVAKVISVVRLMEENLDDKEFQRRWEASSIAQDIWVNQALKPFSSCDNGACASIGNEPFTDVFYSDWFTPFVYYAVSKGYIKGYESGKRREFRPRQPLIRIHALKMLLTDNGNISPLKDGRFLRLRRQADSRHSFLPKCIEGAENHILTLNGGDTVDSQKLLDYVVLADRLDFFGTICEGFGGKLPPYIIASHLQKPIQRREIARWIAISSSYEALNPDPVTDLTINSIEDNRTIFPSLARYVKPAYEEVEFGAEAATPRTYATYWCEEGSANCRVLWGLDAYTREQLIVYEKVNLGILRVSWTAKEEENYKKFKSWKDLYQNSMRAGPLSLLEKWLASEEDWELYEYLSDYQNLLTDEELRELTDEEIFSHLEALYSFFSEKTLAVVMASTGPLKGGGAGKSVPSSFARFKSRVNGKIKTAKVRIFNVTKSESKVWRSFKPHQNGTKTNGLKGRKKRYYEWDHTHNDIEVYNHNKQHLGSMNPISEKMYKMPEKGREFKY